MLTGQCRRALLAALLVLVPIAAQAQDSSPSSQYIPQDAFTVIVGNPNLVLMKPDMSLIPREVISAVSKEATGLDPVDATSVTAFMRIPNPTSAPQWGLIARFDKPQTLGGSYLEQCDEQEINGRPFYVNDGFDSPPSLYAVSDTTVLIGDAETVPLMLRSQMSASPLTELMSTVAADEADVQMLVAWDMIRPLLEEQLEATGPLPPPFGQLADVGESLVNIHAKLDLGIALDGAIEMSFTDAKTAQESADTLQRLLAFGQTMTVAQMQSEMAESKDVASRAMAVYVERIAEEIATSLKPQVDDKTVRIAIDGQFSQTGVLVALLLPAVQSAREAARRTQSMNNLRQLALAMHNYHSAMNEFPARYSVDDDGKPLLSWRVHVLPFLEEQELYEQFHLDEPWDSEHNIQLADKMPAVFSNPNLIPSNRTNYLAIAAEDGVMTGAKAVDIQSILDGTANTVMFVEADENQSVIWTQPEDLEFDADRPLKGLGTLRPGGFNSAFCDGSVRFISNSIDLDVWRAIVTRNGEEIIPFGF